MKDMGKNQEATSAALISSMNEVKRTNLNTTFPGILKAPVDQDKSLGHAKHHLVSNKVTDTASASKWDNDRDYDKVYPPSINALRDSRDSAKYSYDKTSPSSDSEDYHQPKSQLKPTSSYKDPNSKRSSKPLFALARGKGGAISVGLYREHYNKVSFLVEGFKKGRIKEVTSAKEGVKYINSYFKGKGLDRPRWLEKRQEHYRP